MIYEGKLHNWFSLTVWCIRYGLKCPTRITFSLRANRFKRPIWDTFTIDCLVLWAYGPIFEEINHCIPLARKEHMTYRVCQNTEKCKIFKVNAVCSFNVTMVKRNEEHVFHYEFNTQRAAVDTTIHKSWYPNHNPGDVIQQDKARLPSVGSLSYKSNSSTAMSPFRCRTIQKVLCDLWAFYSACFLKNSAGNNIGTESILYSMKDFVFSNFLKLFIF